MMLLHDVLYKGNIYIKDKVCVFDINSMYPLHLKIVPRNKLSICCLVFLLAIK